MQAGIDIVTELKSRSVPVDRIWMVTAYEPQARQDLRLTGVRIFPKPGPLALMVETMLGILEVED